jgi:hypothetical protein
VTGYIGMKNANENPMQYGGRSLAIGGLVMGLVGFLITVIMIIISILAQF